MLRSEDRSMNMPLPAGAQRCLMRLWWIYAFQIALFADVRSYER